MKAHELAHWLLDHGDFDLFLFTGPSPDDTFAAVSAHQGEIGEGHGGFIVLSSIDLSEGAPKAPSLIAPLEEDSPWTGPSSEDVS